MSVRVMRKTIVLIAFVILRWHSSATAGDDAKDWQRVLNGAVDDLRGKGYSVKNVIPIFSQLVAFSFPAGFKPAFENTNGGRYTWEAVLNGESVRQWSQMITVTGAQGLAVNPNLSPSSFLGIIVDGFKKTCPETFSTKGLGNLKIGGYDAFVAVTACGTVPSDANQHSEAAVMVSVKGSNDYYTVQWAERGPASEKPIDLSDVKWAERLKILNPIQICARVPGEAPPYPSCVDQK
jgi:hypothetical protein